MHLERKLFLRIEQLGKDRKARRVRHLLAENLRSMIAPELVQCFPLPRSLPDDALRFRPIDDLPRFANFFARRKFLSQRGSRAAAHPRRAP